MRDRLRVVAKVGRQLWLDTLLGRVGRKVVLQVVSFVQSGGCSRSGWLYLAPPLLDIGHDDGGLLGTVLPVVVMSELCLSEAKFKS